MDFDQERRIVSRRKFLAVAAAGFGTLALAACGGNATPAKQPTSAAPAPAPTAAGSAEAPTAAAEAPTAAAEATADPNVAPTEVPTPTPLVLGTGSQKVTIWHGLAGADGATFVQMLGTYSAAKPDVTLSSELFSDWGVFYQKLPTATAAGTPPDVGIMHSWAIKQFADQSIL